MEQPPIRLPVKPEKGTGKQEEIHPLESESSAPLDYDAIASSFYRAAQQRDQAAAKERIKQVRLGTSVDRRTLYLPEVQFQNKLIALLYPRIFDNSFSLELVTKRLKGALRNNITADTSLSRDVKEQKHESMSIEVEQMMRGIKQVLEVVKERAVIQERSDEYFIGTSDILDATKKIDLVEYARTGETSELRFIQVKTHLAESDLNETMANIIATHQAYLDSFLPTIQEIVSSDYDQQFQAIIKSEGEIFSEDELTSLQKKWNVISIAIGETGGSMLSPRALSAYIEEHLVGYSDLVSVEDILLFKEVITSPQLSSDAETLLDHDFLPTEGKALIVQTMESMEYDLEEVLEHYVRKSGGFDMRSVNCYSLIATSEGIASEIPLHNKLQAVPRTAILT
jgi:hypothetical protein